MTLDKLKQMSEDELFTWFCENAKAQELINDRCSYTIRIGTESKALVAYDTDELFAKLKKRVSKK